MWKAGAQEAVQPEKQGKKKEPREHVARHREERCGERCAPGVRLLDGGVQLGLRLPVAPRADDSESSGEESESADGEIRVDFRSLPGIMSWLAWRGRRRIVMISNSGMGDGACRCNHSESEHGVFE